MKPASRTVQLLQSIRDEVHTTNERLDQTNARLDHVESSLGARIDQMREELSKRIVESELRTSTAITELAGTVHELIDHFKNQADLRPRVERCERDIDAIKAKLDT